MKFQTISTYRLKSKAVRMHNVFKSNGFVFNVYASSESSLVTQYYFVDSKSDSISSGKVVPLAHLQVSRSSGSVKFAALQPENWQLKEDSSELRSRIAKCIANLSMAVA